MRAKGEGHREKCGGKGIELPAVGFSRAGVWGKSVFWVKLPAGVQRGRKTLKEWPGVVLSDMFSACQLGPHHKFPLWLKVQHESSRKRD